MSRWIEQTDLELNRTRTRRTGAEDNSADA
jgi:hypothetical protein